MNESTQALPKEHPRIALLRWQVLDLPVDEDYRALLLQSIDTWREQILERPLYARDEGWDDLEALQQVTLGEMMERALPEQLTVNGAGAFDVGGPEGDNGLSGKKLVMDAYGARVPIGGGAWSGKDFFKADRAGACTREGWRGSRWGWGWPAKRR